MTNAKGVYSMTGFGKGEAQGVNYTLTVEIKSVNNRFKDYRFKMGSIFAAQELRLRKDVEARFKRGSFDIMVNYKRNAENERFDELDDVKIARFIKTMKSIAEQSGLPMALRPVDFLRNEFMIEDGDARTTELNGLLEKAFASAVSALATSRLEEGQKLTQVIRDNLGRYQSHYARIIEGANGYEQAVKEKILKKFAEYGNQIPTEEPRFLQEVIFYLEKLDVHEEISRIQIHLDKFERLLSGKNDEIGRELDFLLQELNRETNTIGSKSGNTDISECVVQMKVYLEKIREQALNIE